MSVFHCPLCPLIFEYRTEVEYHLRNEHRSRADERAALAAELAAASRDLEWGQLRAIQASKPGTAVTILMSTIPGASMSTLDVARLRRLAFQARSRLAAETPPVAPNLEERLNSAVVAAESSPTHEGLAILVSTHELAIFHLPFEPADRVVVDPTFATRDLEAALQCYPRYRVAVLGIRPRLFEGRGLHLEEIEMAAAMNDRTAGGRSEHDGGKRSVRPERWALWEARRRAAIESTDDALSERAWSEGDLPLLIAGDGRWRSTFRKHSRHVASLAGEIPGTRHRDTPQRLARLAQPFLTERLRDEQAAAIAELDRAGSEQALARGIRAAWTAVQDGTADLLWVEQGFSRPARLNPATAAVELVDNSNQPGVIDDIVDDLIEAAIAGGVGLHLLPPGAMGTPEPVAARLRPHFRSIEPAAAAQAV
jgi:hypothetical protein